MPALAVGTMPKLTVAKKPPPTIFGVPIKAFVLVMLVFQNAGAVLLMRYSRATKGQGEFVTYTAVIMQEVLKMVACVIILLTTDGTLSSFYANPVELAKVGVPALLYLFQNNLQYIAVSHLDAATYSVTYQLKILCTALMSVLILGRRLTLLKWVALLILTGGVACVQLSGMSQAKASGADTAAAKRGMQEQIFGLTCIISAALFSGCAGVYFEKILKGAKSSVWTRNLQLASYSVMIGCCGLLATPEFATVQEKGFFHGYTSITWTVIMVNAFGGMLVGLVIKYADNILKDFAIGCSICVSSFASIYIFNFTLTFQFFVGMCLVILAVTLWGRPSRREKLSAAKINPNRESKSPNFNI